MANQRNLLKRAGVAALALAIGAGIGANLDTLKSTTILSNPAYAQTIPPQVQAVPQTAPVSIADVVERVSPAVVTIHVSETSEAPAFPQGTPFDEFFRHFFQDQPGMRQFGPGQQQQARPQPRAARPHIEALGSGFIIDKSGKIVTNNHVVENADKISVELADGRKFDAKLIGRDEKTDLALIQIDANGDLPTIAFGNSDPVRVGDWVVAIGNPFGVGQTATAGIISAHHRTIGAGPFDDFLQLDAPINRGNSGGPTVNLKGEVIGVNTAIFSPSGGSVGIGFAIPSNLAKRVVSELATSGKVERGWLGVHIQEVTPEIADSLNMKTPHGALVAQIEDNSPAGAAGIEVGDVITAVDGNEVKSVRDLPLMIANIKAGDTSKITVLRDGSDKNLNVKIGKTPEGDQVASNAKPGNAAGDVAGLKLGRLDPQTRDQLGLKDKQKGVVITAVDPESGAARAGLSEGDVILSVGNKAVADPNEVVSQVNQAKKANAKTVLLRIATDGGMRFVALPIG
jgi:serine protease Do